VKVPIVTEHMHYYFDKREKDKSDFEREQRGREDGVVELYESLRNERARATSRLRAAIA
jgi:hypothetical protein